MIETLPKNLADRVDFSGDCWLWTAGQNGRGYGRFKLGGKSFGVHRLFWEHFNGKISDGLHVLHKCDVRNCVNPAHLFLGTNADNVADKILKGRYSCLHGENHKMAKLTQAQVDEIRETYVRGKPGIKNVFSQYDLARKFGVSRQVIGSIISYKKWVAV